MASESAPQVSRARPTGTPPAGTLVGGRYRIEGVLGEGGMGRVLLVRHIELQEYVALKVLLGRDEISPEARERLRREARAAARLRGENVARIMDAGECPEHGPFLVMEYVEGRSLGAVLAAEGPLPAARAVDCVLQACAGLAEAHRLGIVHRDVKPSNLMLTCRPDGTELVKVVDFGIAKAEALAGGKLTASESLLGSPRYMSPEQLREASGVDGRADVWSLGVVLYELCTGRLPFEAFTAAGVFARITEGAPVPPREYRSDLPPELEAIILRMLARDREDRPGTVTEVADAIAPFGGLDAGILADRVRRIASRKRDWSVAPPAAVPPPAVEKPAITSLRNTGEGLAAPTVFAPPPQRRARRPLAAGGVVVALAAILALVALRRQPATAIVAAPSAPVPNPTASEAEPSAATSVAAPPAAASPRALDPIVTEAPSAGAMKAPVPSPTSSVAKPAARAVAPRSVASVDVPDFDYGPRK